MAKKTTTHPDKRSIYLPTATWAEVDSRNTSDSTSGTLTEMLGYYLAILARERETLRAMLSDSEMGATLDALNGVWLREPHIIPTIWAEIADADEDGLGEKWGCDAKALAAKVRDMSLAQKTTLVDAVSRWWHRVSAGESDLPSTVAECLR